MLDHNVRVVPHTRVHRIVMCVMFDEQQKKSFNSEGLQLHTAQCSTNWVGNLVLFLTVIVLKYTEHGANEMESAHGHNHNQ